MASGDATGRHFASGTSYRQRFILVVIAGAIVPLALIGFWVNHSLVRAGESLLRSELDSAITKIASSAESRWTMPHGQIILLAQNEAAGRLLAAKPSDPFTRVDSAYLVRVFESSADVIPSVEYRTPDGYVRWALSRPMSDSADERGIRTTVPAAAPTFLVRVPVENGGVLGELVARVRLNRILPSDTALRLPNGARLQVQDAATRTPLLPTALPDSVFAMDRFAVRSADWLAVQRALSEPPLEIAVAAPTRRYVQPFEGAARRGAAAIALAAVFALLFSAALTRRLTMSLESLADAADAVARGDLAARVPHVGPDEVGRVAAAFNSMTENLRRTLGELSQRQALAAVGEYAASLSHEIRNGLTAVRVDLQAAEERIPKDVPGRALITRSLLHVTKLDATVTRSLQLARGGRTPRRRVDLRRVLAAATQNAMGTFVRSGATLETFDDGPSPVWVRGDAPSLEQLFLNLLLNSAQALPRFGSAQVKLCVDGMEARVVVSDGGVGIAPEHLSRVLDPFFSTKTDGTGLGLPIARQIAAAHGGALRVESVPDEGTTVEVRLPLA